MILLPLQFCQTACTIDLNQDRLKQYLHFQSFSISDIHSDARKFQLDGSNAIYHHSLTFELTSGHAPDALLISGLKSCGELYINQRFLADIAPLHHQDVIKAGQSVSPSYCVPRHEILLPLPSHLLKKQNTFDFKTNNPISGDSFADNWYLINYTAYLNHRIYLGFLKGSVLSCLMLGALFNFVLYVINRERISHLLAGVILAFWSLYLIQTYWQIWSIKGSYSLVLLFLLLLLAWLHAYFYEQVFQKQRTSSFNSARFKQKPMPVLKRLIPFRLTSREFLISGIILSFAISCLIWLNLSGQSDVSFAYYGLALLLIFPILYCILKFIKAVRQGQPGALICLLSNSILIALVILDWYQGSPVFWPSRKGASAGSIILLISFIILVGRYRYRTQLETRHARRTLVNNLKRLRLGERQRDHFIKQSSQEFSAYLPEIQKRIINILNHPGLRLPRSILAQMALLLDQTNQLTDRFKRMQIYYDQSQRKRPDLKPIRMATFLDQVCLHINARFPDLLIHIHSNSAHTCLGDADTIQMILDELIHNTMRYTEDKWVRIETSDTASGLMIHYTDANLHKLGHSFAEISRPFAQSDQFSSGVGLALVKRLSYLTGANLKGPDQTGDSIQLLFKSPRPNANLQTTQNRVHDISIHEWERLNLLMNLGEKSQAIREWQKLRPRQARPGLFLRLYNMLPEIVRQQLRNLPLYADTNYNEFQRQYQNYLENHSTKISAPDSGINSAMPEPSNKSTNNI